MWTGAIVTVVLACTAAPSPPAVPTDNPVDTLYGNGSYPWTASINWTNVVSVKDHGGDLTKAQAALTSTGGGVLYLPAGTYSLKENFMLASNVVLRGAPTTGEAKKGTSPGNLAPTTVLSCPDRKHVGVLNLNGTNMGLVNIKMDGCAVMLWPQLGPQPWSMKEYWYEATTVQGMGSNKLVVGCVVQNVNLDSSDPSKPSDGWPWAFSTAVAVYSDRNALVANNLLPKATASATMKLSSGASVPYPYDNRYGIDVNKVLLGGAFGKLVPGASPGHCTDATTFPWSFRPGLVIRDNYVYGNGRVSISFSGGGDGKTIGSGTQVVNNHVEHDKNGIFYGFAPDKQPHGSDTNENRGYDQSGIENNVSLNTGHIYRQKLYNQPYETVDGEGILVQCSNGNNQYRNLWDRNDLSGGGSGYIAYYAVDEVTDCVISNNKVNPDQHIGIMNTNNMHVKDLSCHGNTPKAVCSVSARGDVNNIVASNTDRAHTNAAMQPHHRHTSLSNTHRLGNDQQCGNPLSTAGVFHVTNNGSNAVQLLLCSKFDNASMACDPSAVVACNTTGDALIGANTDHAKYYNVSTGTTQAYAFRFWATQPLSYHALQTVPHTPWAPVPSGSEPPIAVMYPPHSHGSVLCDTDADCPGTAPCATGVCGSPSPPGPAPPPFPPVAIPTADTCDLSGSWKQDPKGDVNVTGTPTHGAYIFVCASHTPTCPGLIKESNGTIQLSSTDTTVTIKLWNGTMVNGVINSTYTCSLVTLLSEAQPGKKAPAWTKQHQGSAPPFDLHVSSATFLGTVAQPLVPVAAAFVTPVSSTSTLTTGTGTGTGGTSEVMLVAGNGPQNFGQTPTYLLNASSNGDGASSNASIVVMDVAAVPPTVMGVVRLGGRVAHMSMAPAAHGGGDYVAVAGDFGVALLQVTASPSMVRGSNGGGGHDWTVLWHDALPTAERGSCGLCCTAQRDFGMCFTSIGTDGTLALVLPTSGETAVVTFGSTGTLLGSTTHSSTVTHVKVVVKADGLSQAVVTTGFYNSNTGHEPMVMPLMVATDYTLTKEAFRAWPWGSGHPYREPGPCDGDVADSRAEIVEVGKTSGELLFVGRSDGGNGVYGCQTDDVNRTAPLLGTDSYSQPFNMQAQAISYLGRLKPGTGQILSGTLNLARLPSGAHNGNTLTTVAVDEDASGNLWYAQTAACCIQNMANLTVQGEALFPAGDGMALEVLAGNLSTRLLWHHFAKANQPVKAGSTAVTVALGTSMAVLVGTSSQQMVEVNPIQGCSGPDGSTSVPQQGYMVVVPQSVVE